MKKLRQEVAKRILTLTTAGMTASLVRPVAEGDVVLSETVLPLVHHRFAEADFLKRVAADTASSRQWHTRPRHLRYSRPPVNRNDVAFGYRLNERGPTEADN